MSVLLKNRGGAGMVLINSKIVKQVPGLFAQSEESDPVAYLRFFTVTRWQWFVLGLDPESLRAYCYVTSPDDPGGGEFGVVYLADLAEIKFFGGSMGVERDRYFTPGRLSTVKGGAK